MNLVDSRPRAAQDALLTITREHPDKTLADERANSRTYGGRTVFDDKKRGPCNAKSTKQLELFR